MTIGILGGGQLGYMLALAGYPLGMQFRFLDPSPEAPVNRLAAHLTGEFTDHATLEKFADGVKLVTYEFENVPVETARFLAKRVPVFPPPQALEAAQNRIAEKQLFRKLGIPTTEFGPVADGDSLEEALQTIGLPAVLKTCRMGYDGKGQWILRNREDVARAKSEMTEWHSAEQGEAPFILERFVPFTRELSILAVRGHSGEIATYPLVENHHREGILRLTLAPAPQLNPAVQRAAAEAAALLCESLQYVGVLAIEFFEYQGRVLASEMAPRVHNSGHWTIEGAITSQFENHLRAVAGLPLGSTNAIGCCAMLNLVGEIPESSQVMSVTDAHLHLYGKTPRPKRKLGHVTLRANSPEQLGLRLAELPGFFHRAEYCLDAALARTVSFRN